MDVFSTMQHTIPVVRPAKLANIHSDLKSPQKNGFAATSLLVPHYSSRKKDRVAMCYHFGLDGALVRHDIEMKPAEGAPTQLSAIVVPKYRWDLNRATKSWSEVRFKSSSGASAPNGVPSASQLQPPGGGLAGFSSSASVNIDFLSGFGSADQEAMVAKQLLANAEIETSDSKTADKPFWQSPVFRLVAWTDAPQGLSNDVSNARPADDDPSIRNGRKADLLLQNDAAYVRTPSRLIPRPRLESGDDGLVQKFAAASLPMSSGRRASNSASGAVMGPAVNVFEGILDDDLQEDIALRDNRAAPARASPVVAAPPVDRGSPVLKPHIVTAPAEPAALPAPASPAPEKPEKPAKPAAVPAIVEPPVPQPQAPSSSKKKKNRKGKGKADSSMFLGDDDDQARQKGSEVSQSTFLLQDALN